jgi:hypothetical protein
MDPILKTSSASLAVVLGFAVPHFGESAQSARTAGHLHWVQRLSAR